jgi:phosphoribosyl 1,2-cyclic phosphate phosphodiesterase
MSELVFIGTGSAMGLPHLFCGCEMCRKILKLGGKNIRLRSSIAIGKKYRFDFSSDSFAGMIKTKLPVYKIEKIFVTHSHKDHLDVNQIMLRFPKYNKNKKLKNLYIYGNEKVIGSFYKDKYQDKRLKKSKIVLKHITNYKCIRTKDMSVWPVPVIHDTRENCLNYVVKYKNKIIYIGFDLKTMSEKSFNFLKKFKFDIAIFESSLGDSKQKKAHLTFNETIDFKTKLFDNGIIGKTTKCFATHFSHYVEYTHNEIIKRLKPYNIVPAYDGLKIKL